MLSFVVPFKDEEPTLGELCRQIAEAVDPLKEAFEVIFVDDGSQDDGVARVTELAAAFPGQVRLIELRGNFGKSAALAAGFEHATGDVVFTLDADLQDDPKEIPRFLEALGGGLDVVQFPCCRHGGEWIFRSDPGSGHVQCFNPQLRH